MKSDVKQNINGLLTMLEEVDLNEVLELAETVAAFAPIPYLPGIIKVLRKVVKFQPMLKSGISMGKKMTADTPMSMQAQSLMAEDSVDVARLIIPPARMTSQRDYDNFVYFMQVAADDGVITSEEQQFLVPSAQKAGYTQQEFYDICNRINQSPS